MRNIPEPVVAFLTGLILGPLILIAVGDTPRHANIEFQRDAITHGYAHYYVNPTNSDDVIFKWNNDK